MRLGELWGRVVDRVMPDRYRDERWADQARAQWERGEPPVGEVETMWYGLFDQEKADAAEAERDRLIDEAAEKFPEYSELDKEQERIYQEAHERGPAMSYPEYEGPGYTEPAINGPENHEDHTEEEREHYWDGERPTEEMSDEEINALALPFEEAEPPENDDEYEATREALEARRIDYYEATGDPWHAAPVTRDEVVSHRGADEYDQDGNPRNDRGDPDAGQYEDEPPVQVADPTMLAVEQSLPEGPERDAFAADREAGTLKTCDDRAAEAADAAQFEKYYGEPPTPASGEDFVWPADRPGYGERGDVGQQEPPTPAEQREAGG